MGGGDAAGTFADGSVSGVRTLQNKSAISCAVLTAAEIFRAAKPTRLSPREANDAGITTNTRRRKEQLL